MMLLYITALLTIDFCKMSEFNIQGIIAKMLVLLFDHLN